MKNKNIWTIISYSISASAKKSVVFASDLFNLFPMCNLHTIIKNRYFSPQVEAYFWFCSMFYVFK